MIAETLFGKGVSNVDPEGDPNSPYMNVDGDLKTNAWGSSDETAKALSILDDGSLENISESLGNYHKVRNFYNNIVSPHSLKGVRIMSMVCKGHTIFMLMLTGKQLKS